MKLEPPHLRHANSKFLAYHLPRPRRNPQEGRGGKAAQSRTVMVSDAESGNNGARSTDFEPLLDVAEAAQLLRMHPKTLRVKAQRNSSREYVAEAVA